MNLDDILFEVIDMDSHFIGPMAHIKKDEVSVLPTATKLRGDGKLLYNTELLDKMGKDAVPQWLGEIVHMSLLHCDRRRSLAAGIIALEAIADLAADLATYQNITQSDKFPQPKDLKLPDGLSMEEYFELAADYIKEQGISLDGLGQSQQGQGQGQQGSGQGDQDGEGKGSGQQDQEEEGGTGDGGIAKNAYQDLMQRMGMKGKHPQDHGSWSHIPVSQQEQLQHVMKEALSMSRGTLPAGLARLLALMEQPAQVKWYEKLRKIVGNSLSTTKRLWTYMKSSRRYGDDYPGTVKERKGQLWGYLDTSGSMDDVEIGIALNEVSAMARAYSMPFNLIMADADIAGVERITGPIKLDKFKVKGGGGTSSRPVFEFLEKGKKKVDLFIGFTDCWNEWPEKPPKFKCVWVTSNADEKHHPPFGETIVIERREKHRR